MIDKYSKQLTIVIPAYNAEKYLRKCLSSLVGVDPRLEIIIIDDGSTDETGIIADQYAKEDPENIQVIHKKNGGHGSAINVGFEKAKGRYLKVVDADDWVVTENIHILLDDLESIDTDVLAAGYSLIDSKGEILNTVTSQKNTGISKYTVCELEHCYKEQPELFTFHGLFYNKSFFQKLGLKLTEGVRYEDQEYAIIPFAEANSITVLPLVFYQYSVGREDQSVSYQNQVRYKKDMETVIKRIVLFYNGCEILSKERESYFSGKMATLVASYYSVALIKNPHKEEGKADAMRMTVWLKENAPGTLKAVNNKMLLLRCYAFLGLPAEFFSNLQRLKLGRIIKKIWGKK